MTYHETSIPGLWLIEPAIHTDERGYFFESYNADDFARRIGSLTFVQDNQSRSKRGVLRGLHMQYAPYEQAKLVRCLEGSIMDVAVDLRPGSRHYGKHFAVELSAENYLQLFVPRGFAHGFITLSDFATVHYKVDSLYTPHAERVIRFDDPKLGIDWQALSGIPTEQFVLSEKDQRAERL
ncbi:dTDP-4-dehydrorhamnose 3,5-epimerase [Porphyromonas sp. COT-239 OH1446]|uniref:dTDP-4-dehydrorhamnose 3,5-epimerase n=1 Tax=Porphyromonas sp. COT-239 OH1446 TaxID=1515613 RepID=UPI00052C5960|nr:dTDP-4-dehydrorhamnose 3,5-epimerase [Porphyromonas sp. COT-239 OH1446]KGN68430.1 dTDP-4-dehydrorhamnose 3,5-epimerase [Porphyromonas sp. COT-239 OH1446]